MTVPVFVVIKSGFRLIPDRNNVNLNAFVKSGTPSGSKDQLLICLKGLLYPPIIRFNERFGICAV